MALFSLQYADYAELKKQGRSFDCESCQKNPQTKQLDHSIAKLRKCFENRWDFTEKDSSVFPIQIHQNGPSFGFCPAKVLRDDPETIMIFQILIVILETGTWPNIGGLNDQEYFWIDLVYTFGPMRRNLEFNEKFNIVAKSLNNGVSKNPIRKSSRGR